MKGFHKDMGPFTFFFSSFDEDQLAKVGQHHQGRLTVTLINLPRLKAIYLTKVFFTDVSDVSVCLGGM